MNPVTFNKQFEPLWDSLSEHGGFTTEFLPDFRKEIKKAVKSAPLLIVRDTGDWKTEDHPLAFDKFGVPIFPFPNFRVVLDVDYRQIMASNLADNPRQTCGAQLDVFVIFNTATENARLFYMAVRVKKIFFGDGRYLDDPYGAVMLGAVSADSEETEYQVCVFRDGKFLNLDTNPEVAHKAYVQKLRDSFHDTYASLHRVAIDYINPSLHLAKVSPKADGRSVEWMKAREHYIFVHKNSPINKKGASGKDFDPNKEIKRTAHSRIAHYRLLKHPRYKAKRGTLIWVRSTWVGPKEWEDASGQIYKLVDHPLQPKPGLELN